MDFKQRNKDYKHFVGNKEVTPPTVKEPKVQKIGQGLLVDGIMLGPNIRPLQCRICGAIWQKLDFTTATKDPRCKTCDHDLNQLREIAVAGSANLSAHT